MKLLGIEEIDNKEDVLNEISKYIFGSNQKQTAKIKEKNFDINLDYKYYFPDFIKYNINLNKDDIDWWEFQSILNAVLLDKNSNIATIISYRTYEKPPKNMKVSEEKEHKFRMEMKRKYALPNTDKSEESLSKLWGYVEKKAGGNKEWM